MARISVREILIDPDLTDFVDIWRRREIIDDHGRVSTVKTVYLRKVAVVTMASPNDLDRKEDYQYASQTISVIMNFALYHEVAGYQPDIVLWRGNTYLVTSFDPYPQFGPGFYETICTSVKHLDKEVLPDFYHKQTVFSNAVNSQLIPVLFGC